MHTTYENKVVVHVKGKKVTVVHPVSGRPGDLACSTHRTSKSDVIIAIDDGRVAIVKSRR